MDVQPTAAPRVEDRAAVAARILHARTVRTKFLGGIEFGEPSWDMLLELYVAEAKSFRISVSSLCIASRVPATTALRWIAILQKAGYVVRGPDASDRRRSILQLTKLASEALDQWIDTCGQKG